MMDLGSMTLSDLCLLRDRLGVLVEAGALLQRLPGDGGAMRFDLTPDEMVVITTHWRAPSAPVSDAAPDFELVDPETPLTEVEAQGVRERIVEMFAGVVPPCAAGILDPAMQGADAWATAAALAVADLDAAASGDASPMTAEVGGGEGVTVQAVASDPSPAPNEIISAAPTPAAETVAPASLAEAPHPTPAEAAPEAAPVGVAPVTWTPDLDAILQELRNRGMTLAQVAGKMGLPLKSVQNRAFRLAQKNTSGTAAPASKPVKPATQEAAQRPAWFREIDAKLTALGYKGGFAPAIDLAIVECIAGQNSPEVVADELGMEVRTMRERFVQLTSDCVDHRGRRKVTVEDQQRLLEVLRARAEGGAK